MSLKQILFVTLFLFCFNASFSAPLERDSLISISGQIIQSKNLKPVPLATITIKSSRLGTVCDSSGVFHLKVSPIDTFKVSALGYKAIDWAIPAVRNLDIPPFFLIKMEEISYLLNEIDIYAFGSWEEFKEKLIHTKLEEKNPINKDIIKQLAPFHTKKPNIVPAQYRPKIESPKIWDAIFSPTDFLYSKFSKTEKIKQKLAHKIRNERKNRKISQKYNATIIANATRLKGDELVAFMEYCGSNIKVNENTSDYEVMRQIMEWFEKYKKEKTTTKE
ncbi:carboxypeptidase-like regulatory domain-containing protein [Ancylomarina longa]|uniref:Carboxypeptidase-like regulatory domain-containing protein n=1 Tax=Ancylomarina longa TaxID=2487017 RepID=A0A434AGJ7_9BACT|nr:carboxypeptidase-like regulatory domain-containing protein [Ancylomarina longa]RUT73510.1 carboxypeptidase-like regulatory domain-containing protein [Ancylomarina longa]